MADLEDPIEVNLRTTIKEVLSITCETHADLARAIGLKSGALVGRRQAGTTQWTIPELVKIAKHWRIPVWCLLDELTGVLRELPEERVAELRAVKGHKPVHFKPPQPVAA